MKNSSLAMVSTIAIVIALASLIGYVDPGACVNPQIEGWSSCESAASQKILSFWIALSIAVASYLGYRLQLRKSRTKRS